MDTETRTVRSAEKLHRHRQIDVLRAFLQIHQQTKDFPAALAAGAFDLKSAEGISGIRKSLESKAASGKPPYTHSTEQYRATGPWCLLRRSQAEGRRW